MQEQGLLKKLSFWHIWALGVGAVIGDGIFLMVVQAVKVAGPAATVSYLISGILIGIVCMACSELAVGMPFAGSLHLWSKRILGPAWGTVAALSEVFMNIIFFGTVVIANGAFTSYFLPLGSDPMVSNMIWSVVIAVVVLLIGLAGGEITGFAQLGLVLLLAGIMVLFNLLGIFSGRIEPQNFVPFSPYGVTGVWAGISMGCYAYAGPLALLTAAGEAKKPTDMPKAMFWAFITFLILYTVAMIVMVGLLDYRQYDSMESPFATATSYVFGRSASYIFNLAAWLAAFTCLVGEIFCVSRLLYGMSEEGVVPKVFQKLNRRRAPWVGMTLVVVIGVLLLMGSNISSLVDMYIMLGMMGVVGGTIAMFITLISAMKYKQKFPEEQAALAWKLPARKLLYPLGFVGVGIIAVSVVLSSVASIFWTAIFIALVFVMFKFYSVPNMARVQREREPDAPPRE